MNQEQFESINIILHNIKRNNVMNVGSEQLYDIVKNSLLLLEERLADN